MMTATPTTQSSAATQRAKPEAPPLAEPKPGQVPAADLHEARAVAAAQWKGSFGSTPHWLRTWRREPQVASSETWPSLGKAGPVFEPRHDRAIDPVTRSVGWA
jgi:hypothetical protein